MRKPKYGNGITKVRRKAVYGDNFLLVLQELVIVERDTHKKLIISLGLVLKKLTVTS